MNTLTKVVSTATKQVPTVGRLTETAINFAGFSQYQNVPLHEQLAETPEPTGPIYGDAKITMSTLSNGVRVVSRDTGEVMSNVGIYVDVGSRFLAPHSSGAIHYLADMQMNFFPTKTRSLLQASTDFYRMGSTMQISAYRDCLLYRGECFRSSIQGTMDVVADLAMNSELENWIVNEKKNEYLWRRGDNLDNTEELIPELMHQAAYCGNTYGLPLHMQDTTQGEVSGEVMRYLQAAFFQPSRIIAVGVGVAHEALEDVAFNSLGHLREGEGVNSEIAKAAPNYTGGELRLSRELDGQVHVGLCFETENWHSKDVMAMSVLNVLMGGGGSFSPGGPGKGMYSRLYQDALARFNWISHISCNHSVFEDTGLFSYYGTSQPEHAGRLVDVMIHQAKQAAEKVASPEELARAKNCLAANICYEYEKREVQFEDVARQAAVYGTVKSPEEWQPIIEAVTAQDVQRVAQKMIKTTPTLVSAGGDLSQVPTHSQVSAKF